MASGASPTRSTASTSRGTCTSRRCSTTTARLDEKIGRLLRFADDDTAVLVVSDHGAKRMDGGICVNEWLRREGYLVLKRGAGRARAADPGAWSTGAARSRGARAATTAGSSSTSRAASREGIVAPDDYERVRDELKAKLEALGDEEGRPIGTVAHRPEELYDEPRGVAPDLLVYFGDLYWRSIGQVGTGTVHVFENDTGPDDANHAHEGLYVLAAPGVEAGRGPGARSAGRRADDPRSAGRAGAPRDGGREPRLGPVVIAAA